MAERGAVPQVSEGRRRVLGLMRSFTSPLLPDDYLELVNPLWSTRELRGRIERVERETPDAVDGADQAGLGVAGPPTRAVPAAGHRGRRRAPLARVLADLGSGSRRRLHRDHPEARARRQGLAVPVRPRDARGDRAAGRRRRHVRAARAAAAAAAVHQRRQRGHADHEHAAQHRARATARGRRARALRAHARPG